MSICHPLSWTWPSITSYLHSIDSDGTLASQAMGENIADFMSNYLQKKQCENIQNCPPTGWQYHDILMAKFIGGMLNNVTEASQPLKKLVEEVAKKNQLNILSLWRFLNEPLLVNFFERYWPETDLAKEEMEVKDALNKLSKDEQNEIYQTLQSPKVHGDYLEEYVLVPLCSFGSKVLKKCDLFERQEKYYRNNEVCYTFNKKGNYSANSLRKLHGLNFVVNLRLPGYPGPGTKPQVVVHSHNEIPDRGDFPAATHPILAISDSSLFIGVEASIINVTSNFEKMGETKRNCYLNIGKEAHYSRNKCQMMKAVELAESTCSCIPWFLKSNNSAVCDSNGLSCFYNFTENYYLGSNVDRICQDECVSTQYDLTFGEIFALNDPKNIFGKDWKNFLSDDNPMYYTSLDGPKYRIVHVNFVHKKTTVIRKDAKVTFADMLGSIGGTIGVFIGLSFVGLLDFFQGVCNCVKEMWLVKSKY